MTSTDRGQGRAGARGWQFWLRTGWWAFTHPFSPPDDNPGVQATLDDFAQEVRRIERERLIDFLRSDPTSDANWNEACRKAATILQHPASQA